MQRVVTVAAAHADHDTARLGWHCRHGHSPARLRRTARPAHTAARPDASPSAGAARLPTHVSRGRKWDSAVHTRRHRGGTALTGRWKPRRGGKARPGKDGRQGREKPRSARPRHPTSPGPGGDTLTCDTGLGHPLNDGLHGGAAAQRRPGAGAGVRGRRRRLATAAAPAGARCSQSPLAAGRFCRSLPVRAGVGPRRVCGTTGRSGARRGFPCRKRL